MKYLWSSALTLLLICCNQDAKKERVDIIRSDFRFGTRYYSVITNENGEGYVIKGSASTYTEPFVIKSTDTSSIFRLDSVDLFFQRIQELKQKQVSSTNFQDNPRTEIYYNESKVLDTYLWDEKFWYLFRPIMHQLPQNFNPFRLNDQPFDNN